VSRPVARAGIAAAILFAFTGLGVLAIPAVLPSWHVAWLVKPLIGVEVRPFHAEYLSFASGADLAVSIALDAIGIGAVAFYLDHCVIDQPLWAVVAGWGLLLGGFATLTLQDAVGTSRMTFIDIDHYWWPLGLVLIVIGATVILVSWWRAPELFSPHLSRRTVLVLVPVVAIIVFARQSGMAPTVTLALCALIVSMALTAGSWMAGRSSGQSGGERDPA